MHRLINLYMTKQTFKRITWLLCIPVVLTACEKKAEVVKMIRSIDTVTIGEQAGEQTGKYSGIVAAVDSSGLSFEIGGQVESVEVDIGDSVKKGQELQVLIPSPISWMSMPPRPTLSRPKTILPKQRQSTSARCGFLSRVRGLRAVWRSQNLITSLP